MLSKMKRFLLLLMSCLWMLSMRADYYVFSTNNRVERKHNQTWSIAIQGEPLDESDSIRMEAYASLSLLDDREQKVYAIQCESPQTVQYLVKQSQRRNSRLSQTFAVAKAILSGQGQPSASQQYGVTYRSSKVEEAVAAVLKQRLQGDIWTSQTILTSDGRIEIQLKEMVSGKFMENVNENDWVQLLITNYTNQDLYVAVVDIDRTGVPSPILPTDIAEVILHQHIPPLSSVLLPYPLSFSPQGTDGLFVIGYPEPFDMTRVIELLPSAQAQEGKLYVGYKRVQIQ